MISFPIQSSTQSTWPTRASGPSATDRPGMLSFSARSVLRERQASKLIADGTPMNNKHFFTPVTEVDESHFGFGTATARSSPAWSRAELSPQASALVPLFVHGTNFSFCNCRFWWRVFCFHTRRKPFWARQLVASSDASSSHF